MLNLSGSPTWGEQEPPFGDSGSVSFYWLGSKILAPETHFMTSM